MIRFGIYRRMSTSCGTDAAQAGLREEHGCEALGTWRYLGPPTCMGKGAAEGGGAPDRGNTNTENVHDSNQTPSPRSQRRALAGVVGKGSPGRAGHSTSTQCSTERQRPGRRRHRFDAVHLFLLAPHVEIISTDDDSAAAPTRSALATSSSAQSSPRSGRRTGGGSAMGTEASGKTVRRTGQRKVVGSPKRLRDLGVRPTASSPHRTGHGRTAWEEEPEGQPERSPPHVPEAGAVARTPASGSRRRAKSDGGGSTRGSGCANCSKLTDPARHPRLPADMATPCSTTLGLHKSPVRTIPAGRNGTGPTPKTLDTPLRQPR